LAAKAAAAAAAKKWKRWLNVQTGLLFKNTMQSL
jgi:hypothetical protein